MNLACSLGKIDLKNPVMNASGCFDWFPDFGGYLHPDQFGAVVLKSTTLKAREGNPPPRIAEVPHGLVNSIGIPSDGVDAFVKGLKQKWTNVNVPLISSISAFSPEEYAELAAILDKEEQIAAFEVNLSCPNLEHAILPAQDAVLLKECLCAVRNSTSKPVIAKLSPNVADITKMAIVCEDARADAICLINTVRGMAIDIYTKKPVLGNITGGLAGPTIKPIALSMVYQVCGAVSIPVIGVGGISSAEDAIEFLLAGASAVQIGSSLFRDPLVVEKVLTGLRAYLDEYGYASVSEIIGLAQKRG